MGFSFLEEMAKIDFFKFLVDCFELQRMLEWCAGRTTLSCTAYPFDLILLLGDWFPLPRAHGEVVAQINRQING